MKTHYNKTKEGLLILCGLLMLGSVSGCATIEKPKRICHFGSSAKCTYTEDGKLNWRECYDYIGACQLAPWIMERE